MLLQTNSYIVPKDKRAEHARLLRRFRAALAKLGCDSFEVYEQVGANWNTGEPTGRYVQIMRFRDRRHQVAVQQAERNDPLAQTIIAEFCQLINFPYQQQQGLFAVGFYNSVLPVAPTRPQGGDPAAAAAPQVDEPAQPADADTRAEPLPPAEGSADAALQAEETDPSTPADSAEAPARRTDAAAAGSAAGHDPGHDERGGSDNGGVDDLGALLDAHLTGPLDEDLPDDEAHPLDEVGHHDHGPHGLEALDLCDLEMPDERSPDPQRAPDHASR